MAYVTDSASFQCQVMLSLLVFSFVMAGVVDAGTAKLYGSTADGESGHDQYIVVFKNHSCDFPTIINHWHQRFSSKRHHYQWHKHYQFSKFAAARLTLHATTLQSIRNDPEVKYIEVNREIRISARNAVVDDSCQRLVDGTCMQQSTGGELWGLSRIGMRPLSALTSAKYTFLDGDGTGVNVYVVDTGVYAEHAEFEGRAAVQFVSSELTAEGPMDENGHGTHVSGTIAGKTYGVAKSANIIGVKVLGNNGVGTLGGLLEGLEWVHQDFQAKLLSKTKNVKAVVNLSIGGAPGEIETLDEAAITLISEAGLPFVVAAGNDNTDACLVSPARVSVAITTGATNQKDVLSSFSNFGPCVDMLAPGEFVLSSFIGTPTTAAILSGTSMATPHVTGVIARYLSQSCRGRPSPSDIKAWVQDMSTKSLVDLQTRMSTPNRILYMFCLAESELTLPRDEIPAVQNRYLYIYIGIGLVGVLCLLVLLFICVTYREVKDISAAQSRPLKQYYTPTGYNTFNQTRVDDHSHPTV